jgi:small subunit ribosomal protein S8
MVTDPIADLLIRLQNAARRRHDVVSIPASKLKRNILMILQSEGYIHGIEDGINEGHPVLLVQLRYIGEHQPMITGMKRISKPGRRVYVGSQDVPKVQNGIGLSILSTSKGVMTDQDSRRAKLGGELLCTVW